MDISGKTAIVTGASSGIGRACAHALARAGASVLVADVDVDGGHDTVASIEDEGGRAGFAAVDVSVPGDLAAMFDAAEDRFEGVDILYNNAGIVCGEPLWPRTEPERLLRQVMVNLGAVVVGTRLAVDRMARRGGGCIVNTASLGALLPLSDEPAYSATKAGVVMFTRACAALEDTHKIRVNAVLPCLVETPLLAKSGDGTREASWAQLGRQVFTMVTPEEVADAMVEITRDDALAGHYRIVGDVPDFVADALGGVPG